MFLEGCFATRSQYIIKKPTSHEQYTFQTLNTVHFIHFFPPLADWTGAVLGASGFLPPISLWTGCVAVLAGAYVLAGAWVLGSTFFVVSWALPVVLAVVFSAGLVSAGLASAALPSLCLAWNFWTNLW